MERNYNFCYLFILFYFLLSQILFGSSQLKSTIDVSSIQIILDKDADEFDSAISKALTIINEPEETSLMLFNLFESIMNKRKA